MSKRLFVDTSAWIMLLNQSEQHHREAVKTYNERQNNRMVTTNLIIGETYTWLRKKGSFQAAFEYLQSIKRKADLKQLEVIYSDLSLEQQALRLLEKYQDHQFSYADAVSFCVMQNLGIKEAFAYDLHFVVAGFKVINEL
jgi:uncharacterized protein